MRILIATIGCGFIGALAAIVAFSALSAGYGKSIGLGAPVNAMVVSVPDSVSARSTRAGPAAASEPEQIAGQLNALRKAAAEPKDTVARINALFATNSFVAAYAKAKQTFPNSNGKMVPAANMLKVLASAELEKNVRPEMFAKMRYVSDGKSYKLIIVGAGDCAVVRALRPAMVDPQRSAGELDCIAYGFWTPKGASY